MTEENEASTATIPVEAEDAVEQGKQESKRVPVEALLAERRKRQDAEAQYRAIQEHAMKLEQSMAQRQQEAQEDETDLVNKGDLKRFHQKLTKEEFTAMKREIAEETFKDSNPEAIRQINAHLKDILEKKPWLAETIESASNRYARAYEIVQDFAPVIKKKADSAKDIEKIAQNSQKPGSPVAAGKNAQLSQADYLKSIAGTKEFADYRRKLLGR